MRGKWLFGVLISRKSKQPSKWFHSTVTTWPCLLKWNHYLRFLGFNYFRLWTWKGACSSTTKRWNDKVKPPSPYKHDIHIFTRWPTNPSVFFPPGGNAPLLSRSRKLNEMKTANQLYFRKIQDNCLCVRCWHCHHTFIL